MNINTPLRFDELSRKEIIEDSANNFTKYLSCLAHTAGNRAAAAEVFTTRFNKSHGASQLKTWLETGTVDLFAKAITAPGTTTDATWAKPLVGMESWANGFLQIAHSQSLLGRIPGLQQIPFNTKVPYATSDANFVWVAEMAPTPTSKLAFSDGLLLSPTKVLGIIVLTEEFAKLSNSGTTTAMRTALTSGLNAFVDKSFLDPASVAIAGQRPASITSTAGAPLTGTSDVAASVKALIAAFFAARPGATNPVLIASGGNAAAIRGQVPGFGVDVIPSEAVGTNIVMLDPAGVFYADGGLEVAYSREAMLEMVDNPAAPTAATVFTSLYQNNLIGYKLTRFVSFGAAPNAVKYSTMP